MRVSHGTEQTHARTHGTLIFWCAIGIGTHSISHPFPMERRNDDARITRSRQIPCIRMTKRSSCIAAPPTLVAALKFSSDNAECRANVAMCFRFWSYSLSESSKTATRSALTSAPMCSSHSGSSENSEKNSVKLISISDARHIHTNMQSNLNYLIIDVRHIRPTISFTHPSRLSLLPYEKQRQQHEDNNKCCAQAN